MLLGALPPRPLPGLCRSCVGHAYSVWKGTRTSFFSPSTSNYTPAGPVIFLYLPFSLRNLSYTLDLITNRTVVESFYVELNFLKKKWLLICSYNPSNIESHLESLSKTINSLPSTYDNFILLHDFNSYIEDSPLKTLGEIYKLWNVIKKPVCFKNPENPTCIDIILGNKPLSFKNTYVTGLSDFHIMTVAMMKMHFPKIKLCC